MSLIPIVSSPAVGNIAAAGRDSCHENYALQPEAASPGGGDRIELYLVPEMGYLPVRIRYADESGYVAGNGLPSDLSLRFVASSGYGMVQRLNPAASALTRHFPKAALSDSISYKTVANKGGRIRITCVSGDRHASAEILRVKGSTLFWRCRGSHGGCHRGNGRA